MPHRYKVSWLALMILAGCSNGATGFCLGNAPAPRVTPSYPAFTDVVPGSVSVIFQESLAPRASADKRSLTSQDCRVQNAVNEILSSNLVEELHDFSGGDANAPATFRAMFIFQFPQNADTASIAAKLRMIGGVQTAYPTGKVST